MTKKELLKLLETAEEELFRTKSDMDVKKNLLENLKIELSSNKGIPFSKWPSLYLELIK